MEDRFRAAEGDDRHGQGRARAGAVRKDRTAGDRQRGRIETAETADGEDLRGFAGQRERVDGLSAREGIGLQAGGLVGRRPGGGKDVLSGREAREGDDTVGRVIGREAVPIDGHARDQAVRQSWGGREGDPVGRGTEGAGDVERAGRVGAERSEGEALFAAAAHDDCTTARLEAEGGRRGVGGLRRGRERLSRAGGGRVSADDELGAIGDRDDRRADRDVRTGHHHARLKARGASDGDGGAGVDGRASSEGLGHDCSCVGDELEDAAAHVEHAGGDAETVHRVRRRVVEDELSVLEHDHATRRIAQGAGADDVRGAAVDAVMVVREGVGGRDVDDVVVDLVDVETIGGRAAGVVDITHEIDDTLAEEVEEHVPVIGRGHVRPEIAEVQNGIEVRTDSVVAVDVIVSADRIQQVQLPADGVGTRDRTDRARTVDAGHVGPVAGAGQVDNIGEGDATGELERGGHAADIQGAGGQLVRGRGADDAGIDVELAGPAGVGGTEDERAGRLLGQRGADASREFERRGERGGLAGRDFDLTGVGGVTEDDRTSEGKVFGET